MLSWALSWNACLWFVHSRRKFRLRGLDTLRIFKGKRIHYWSINCWKHRNVVHFFSCQLFVVNRYAGNNRYIFYVLRAEWLVLWTSTQSTWVRFLVSMHDWFGFQNNQMSRVLRESYSGTYKDPGFSERKDYVIPSLQEFSSSKVDNDCFSSDATLCVNKEMIIIKYEITIVRGVKYYRRNVCAIMQHLQNKVHILQTLWGKKHQLMRN